MNIASTAKTAWRSHFSLLNLQRRQFAKRVAEEGQEDSSKLVQLVSTVSAMTPRLMDRNANINFSSDII